MNGFTVGWVNAENYHFILVQKKKKKTKQKNDSELAYVG